MAGYVIEQYADGYVLRPPWTSRRRHVYLNRRAVVLFYWLLALHVERRKKRRSAPFNKRRSGRMRRAERRFKYHARETRATPVTQCW